MKQLSENQMNNAMYAHACNESVDHKSGFECAKEMMHSAGGDTRFVREYELGLEVLKLWSIVYSGRNTTGIPDPANATNYIVTDSGYIATSQAYRTARFYPKQ